MLIYNNTIWVGQLGSCCCLLNMVCVHISYDKMCKINTLYGFFFFQLPTTLLVNCLLWTMRRLPIPKIWFSISHIFNNIDDLWAEKIKNN